MKKKQKIHTAEWKLEPNPLYWVICPHCKADVLMAQAGLVERLKRWAKRLTK